MLRAARTPLSKQAGILRTTLLLSLGLPPLACGGSAAISGNRGGSGGRVIDPPVDPGGGTSGYSDPIGGGPQGGTGDLSTAGTSSSGSSGGGVGPIGPSDCPNPVYNPTTQLTECSNGRWHRPMSIACTYNATAGAGGASGGSAGAAGGNAGSGGVPTYCMTDAECSGLPLGFCRSDGGQVPVCAAGCITDADCGASSICACDGFHPGRCVNTDCVTDADCGPNSLCAAASSGCKGLLFRCTSPQDTCISAECRGQCEYQAGHRACSNFVCGRPFLIAERARMAAVEARADWLDPTLTPDPSGLTPLERAQLAAHWARLGQMEHASIAAFARFNLQLLSLGAPSRLVEACNRAICDETAHARSCFALASAYGGNALGPARLDIEHCFEDTSLLGIAKLVLREGCLGETAAALEALAAAEVAREPAVKQALQRIASDELAHADLAFQFLRWALSLSSPEERHELGCEAAQQLADFESNARHGQRTATDDRLAAHGLLGSDALSAIHLAAARDVSRPLLAALFELEEPSAA